jgi:hypothetical protein
LVVLSGLLVLVALVMAGEPPQRQFSSDTAVITRVVTYADTAAVRILPVWDNHRRTIVLVPHHRKPGDTLLVVDVWEGVPVNQVQAQQQSDRMRRALDELDDALHTLDSLERLKKKK